MILSSSAKSQYANYFGAEQQWTQSSSCMQGSDDCLLNTEFIYYVAGDTDVVATGELYYVIRKVGTSTYELLDSSASGLCTGSFTFDNIAALLRQEGRKIWMYNFTTEEEELLYDFTLGEGDTLPVTPIQPYENVIVENVDSFSIGVHYLKKFYIASDYCAVDYIIEGIGSNFGFLEEMVDDSACDYSHGCYSMYGELIWSKEGSDLCGLVVGLEEKEEAPIKLYPNPVNNLLYLEGIKGEANIKLYDQTGRELPVDFNGHTIGVTSLSGGSYILYIEDGSGVQAHRFVKR